LPDGKEYVSITEELLPPNIFRFRFRCISSPWIIIHDIGQVNHYTVTHYNKKVQSVSNIFVLANAASDQTNRRPAPAEAVIVSDSPPSRMGISLALA
jgi:hypothetical protein